MSQAQRLEGVDQLRGLAALSVSWFHLTNQYHDWVAQTGMWGWLGVEAFFVISGFVIPLSLASDWTRRGSRALPRFLLRRLMRIEPPYFASVLLVVLLNFAAAHTPGFAGTPPEISAKQMLAHAAYIIPLTHHEWLQPVYWTLAFESIFYLSMPALIIVLVGTRQLLVRFSLMILLGTIAIGGASPLLGLFAMGCVVFRAFTGRTGPAETAALLGIVGLAMSVADARAQALVGIAAAAIMLLPQCAQGFSGPLGRALNGLGGISFSLYLLHIPIGGKIVNLGQRWLQSSGEHLVLSIAALASSLVCAAIFWRFVERPCIAAARSLSGSPKPVQPAVAP